MKRTISVITVLVLCFSLLLTTSAAVRKPGGKTDEKFLDLKVKAAYVKKPPYKIQARYSYYHGDHGIYTIDGYIMYYSLDIELIGNKTSLDDRVTGDDWEFDLKIDEFWEQYTTGNEPEISYLRTQIFHTVLTGSAKATLTDDKGKTGDEFVNPFEEAEKKAEAKKKRITPNLDIIRKYLDGQISYEGYKEEIKKALEKKKAEESGTTEPKESYKASFTIPGSGAYAPPSHTGIVIDDRGEVHPFGTLDDYLPGKFTGNIDFNVELSINELNYVNAVISYTDAQGYTEKQYLTGSFICQNDIDVKFSATKDIPVWGAWTDKDIYAPLPKILKDYDKRYAQLQARKTDPSAKVDTILYNNGKWLVLNKSKKIEYEIGGQSPLSPAASPFTYEMVEITDDSILYERGEMSVLFRFEMHPEVKYEFPRDHQDNMSLFSEPLAEYAQPLISTSMVAGYNFYSDTLTPRIGFFTGTTLRRVREGIVCETWSNVEGVEKPDPSKIRSVAGVWYEFKLQKGEYTDLKDGFGNTVTDENGDAVKQYKAPEVGGYTWERVTVNSDGTAVVLSGYADIDYFDENLRCDIYNRTVYDNAGNAMSESYGPADPDDDDDDYEYDSINLHWSDYDKSAGTTKLNDEQFYKVSKSALNGTWTTGSNAPPLPDVSKEDARAAIIANYAAPVEWLKLESAKGEFTRLTWTPGEGMLKETGTYKTLGDSQLVLEDIIGTYYNSSGGLVFIDELSERQSDILDYFEVSDSVIHIGDIGKMYKTV